MVIKWLIFTSKLCVSLYVTASSNGPCRWANIRMLSSVYIMDTIDHRLFFQKSNSLAINAYFDADWANCPYDKKSIGGLCIFLGFNPEPIVSRFSIEAEYQALAKIIWLQSLRTWTHSCSKPSSMVRQHWNHLFDG
jgi:hypothetical protein